eukprot:4772816-Alexandrium_andersonii.AAC.1
MSSSTKACKRAFRTSNLAGTAERRPGPASQGPTAAIALLQRGESLRTRRRLPRRLCPWRRIGCGHWDNSRRPCC